MQTHPFFSSTAETITTPYLAEDRSPDAKPETLLERLARRYDVTALTIEQLKSLAAELQAAGVIDIASQKILSFDSRLPSNSSLMLGLLGNLHSAPDQPRNTLQIWRNIATLLDHENAPSSVLSQIVALSRILERLHHMRRLLSPVM